MIVLITTEEMEKGIDRELPIIMQAALLMLRPGGVSSPESISRRHSHRNECEPRGPSMAERNGFETRAGRPREDSNPAASQHCWRRASQPGSDIQSESAASRQSREQRACHASHNERPRHGPAAFGSGFHTHRKVGVEG